eukprot:symbB.v1.2.015829.t1/scaffold1194.1/size132594/2
MYSNRAAALTKLLAYPDALRDLDECLKLDPTFVKAYSRKGAAHLDSMKVTLDSGGILMIPFKHGSLMHFFMKEYHKSLQAYEQGLKLDPENQECKQGRDQVLAKISETSRSTEVHGYGNPREFNSLPF